MTLLNRQQAGEDLAQRLAEMAIARPVVIALPRGGVPVGSEVARTLKAPLDVLIARKIGAPGNPEFGIGAITEDGTLWKNDQAVRELRVSDLEFRRLAQNEQAEIKKRTRLFRDGHSMVSVENRNVILVDDGIATGVTARAAIRSIRNQGAASITLAVPVGAPDSIQTIENEVDRVLCLEQPEGFYSVGAWYQDFEQISDEEVVSLLEQSRENTQEIELSDGIVRLSGTLAVPAKAKGIVIFAHGSGSSRHSTRNIQVARELNRSGLATLLFDLLDPEEGMDRENVFDIPLLAGRLILAYSAIRQKPETAELPVGFFGASTGAAAAILAASKLKNDVAAIVSRGGRPDLAFSYLGDVSAPTLLIVGGRDEHVLDLNRNAHDELAHSKLLVITDATHLFEEPGALDAVARAAAEWFKRHFVGEEEKQVA